MIEYVQYQVTKEYKYWQKLTAAMAMSTSVSVTPSKLQLLLVALMDRLYETREALLKKERQ